MRGAALSFVAIVGLAASSHAINFQTSKRDVLCGIAMRVPGSRLDAGTGVALGGDYPGLQCAAAGIPKPRQGIGDPFVQLGQGRAGRARIVNESQDDLVSGASPATLASGSRWQRDGISCTLTANSVRCTNAGGHGFELRTGHVTLF